MRLLSGIFSLLLCFFASSVATAAPNLNYIDQLAQKGKLGDINKQLPVIIKQAKARRDNKTWRDALLLLANTKLNPSYTETVKTLTSQPWPNDPDSRLLLNLHLAHYLSRYIAANRWQIRNREIIKSKGPVPLEKKSLDQLLTDMHQAFAKAYNLSPKNKKTLKQFAKPSLKRLNSFFTDATYPEKVRGTLRDTVAYLWTATLVDSSYWTPAQDSQASRLLTAKLLTTPYRESVNPSDLKKHPLKRAVKILSDLELFQRALGNTDGALEAFRVRIEAVSGAKSSEPDKKQLIQALRLRIKQQLNTKKPSIWLDKLRLDLAKKLRNQDVPDANIHALTALQPCLDGEGLAELTARCKAMVDEIKAPYLSLESRASDGLNKRSVKLTHTNLDTVYFKAWKVDSERAVSAASHNRSSRLIARKIAQRAKPDFTWQASVTKTADHNRHATYITPPMKELGYWLIAASNKQEFPKKEAAGSYLVATTLNLSNLVADVRADGTNIEVVTYQGESGQPLAGVTVEAWQQHQKQPAQRAISDQNGVAKLSLVKDKQYNFFLRYKGDTTTVDSINTYNRYRYSPKTNNKVKDALVFTDRAIYRPAQTIKWKVVAYQGDSKQARYRISPKSKGWVSLYDANNKVVKKIAVTTNHFGSASGEFTVKADRLLGNWRIKTAWGGDKSIKVEEYKRPTFKAKIAKPKQGLRLNYTAKITGEAEYYFGGAVTEGNVSWRIKRLAVYARNTYTEEEVVANGTTKLNAKGEFVASFKPIDPLASGSKPDATTSYRYQLSADITDSGGETRSVNRTFTIGHSSLKAEITPEAGFAIAGRPFKLTINRQDLGGNAVAGSAFWSLHRIQQPKQTFMPSELPVEVKNKRFATKGDGLQSRWADYKGLESYIGKWRDAQKLAQGSIRHDASGSAVVTIKAPSPGLYRLRYTTKDQWGQLVKQTETIVVSNQQKTLAKVPAHLSIAKSSAEVGERISLLAGAGFQKSPALLEVFHGNKLVRRSVQRGGITKQPFTVTKAHRGGLNFVLTMVKDHQLVRQEKYVSVPWTDRELNVSFSTFRDKLRPGQKETWRISVKDSKNRPLERGAAEVLASMFDNSLELFGKHSYPSTSGLYPSRQLFVQRRGNGGVVRAHAHISPPYKRPLSNPYYNAELTLARNFLHHYACHTHPANSKTKAVGHCHKNGSPNHTHGYGGKAVYVPMRRAASGQMMSPRRMAAPMRRAAPARAPQQAVDVFALQSKLKAHRYYNGPIDGTVGDRAALQQFMQNRNGASPAQSDAKSGDADEVDLNTIKTRKNFNETAFFKPHLLLEKDGTVTFEFEVPESLTQWKVWVSAITRDLRGGSTSAISRTSKELMVRPYLPRFLRVGDEANIEVLINNAGDKPMNGKMSFDIIDPATDKTIAATFKLNAQPRAFNVAAGQSTRLRYSLVTPKDLGMVTIRAKASASNGKEAFGDGEQRPLPVLPSRIHLAQSRFAALQGNSQRQLRFNELARNTDSTRINDKLVVNVDGQLLYSTLNALPYLTKYPYECTEQTMNRFLSTSIINRTFAQSPALIAIRKQLVKRGSRLAKWDADNKDANNRILLEETPWLNHASGNTSASNSQLLNILDPAIANAQQKRALAKLVKAQNKDGGFPWWDGGKSSPYMTMYLLQNFAKATEFNIAVPKGNVQRAWKYLHAHYVKEILPKIKKPYHLNTLTTLSYMLSSYRDNSWTGGVFKQADRQRLLNLAFASWLRLPNMLKGQLALALKRSGRHQEAAMVFESVMNSARTDKDNGTYWVTQANSWLWYNDRIDTHAFILRAMMEVAPQDKRRHGLVQWLMLNKKLNHWKSTRATAESIYSLVHYMRREGQLGQEERLSVNIGNTVQKDFVFKPHEYTGGKQQFVVEDKDITPDMATIKLDNKSKSLMFASATWHFSTEKPPASAQGDFFGVTRRFFKRKLINKKWVLQPLAEGATVKVGDQLEVQLNLRSKHNAEYVHLRAPRGAGFEPMETNSGYRWQGGTGFYQEIRDSGMNYFFDSLRKGQYQFKYRLRATTSGRFRVAPAQVQSVYAPEFNAYSRGSRLTIR